MASSLARRSFLRGACGVIVALPFLESLAPKKVARGAPTPSPKRYVSWFTFMGSLPQYELVEETASGLVFPAGSVLAPLEKIKHKVSILRGVNMASLRKAHGPSAGHSQGCAHAFTSAKTIQCKDQWGQDVFFPVAPNASSSSSDGKYYPNQCSPSIDQAIANRIDTQNVRYKSILAGDGSDHAEPIFYGENSDMPQRWWNPKWLFDSLFAEFASSAETLTKVRASRKSVLDAVLADAQALDGRISQSDKLVLAAHLDSIRDVEKSIADGGSCNLPGKLGDEWNNLDGVSGSALGTKSYEQLLKLVALGLKCDLYRVGAVQLSGRMVGLTDIIPDLSAITSNPNRNVHEFSHIKWNEDGVEVWRRIITWRYKLLADFCADLDSAPEADGKTVLDNTVILHGNELLTGLHDATPDVNYGYSGIPECPTCPDQYPPARPNGLPMLYVGSAGGALKTGKVFNFRDAAKYDVNRHFTDYGQYSHGEVMLTMARAMGVGPDKLPTFGDPEVCKNVAKELLVAG